MEKETREHIIEQKCLKVLGIKLRNLEKALTESGEIMDIVGAAEGYKAVREIVKPYIKDFSELDSKYDAIMKIFEKYCEEID